MRCAKPTAVFSVAVLLIGSLVVGQTSSPVWLDDFNLPDATTGWWRIERRTSVQKHPLSLRGTRYGRGLGTHARSEIPIDLLDGASALRAVVGIDDETKGNGTVEFIVVGDGKELWKSAILTGNSEPVDVNVPLAGIRQLRLVVTMAGNGYANDHADWCDARFENPGPQLAAAVAAMRASPRPLPFCKDHPPPGATMVSMARPTEERLAALRRLAPEADDEALGEYLYCQAQLDDRQAQLDAKLRAQTYHPEALIQAEDTTPFSVVLRRTRALAHHLQERGIDVSQETGELSSLAADQPTDESPGLRLFLRARQVRRRIALRNPEVGNIRRLVFIKRHFNPEPEKMGNHMCDQFFGFHGQRGGGLFVLDDPFGPEPRLRDLLADAACENGRFKGRKLDSTGAFLSPEVSFDGETIYFAYADVAETPARYTWTQDNCYHLFSIQADGTKLRQLTDGAYNDFDPCELPSGRLAFISERRGGYGRCHGRPVPSFTLHSMLPDGSDIVCLSPHETNEWQPSVDASGMIAYTRWDYVDRGHTQAHHAWTTYPDGRDPRAVNGNFRTSLRHAPTMEMDVRAIPNSRRYVATAAAHHGQAYGSLILIDPRVEDDNDMAPVKRLTPDQALPETECSAHRDPLRFATAWPLSEQVYLCVYDRFSQSNQGPKNNYGIYLVDVFGNRELVYRDPAISCLSPLPLQSRPKPLAIPHATLVGLPPGEAPVAAADLPRTAIVGVNSVYNTRRPFPEGTRVTALRVIQLLPKTTPYAHNPAIGYGQQKSARAVLGTVPVEADGSAYLRVPVDVPVYFQALDQNGLAVQSMRSATYVKPGERLLCQGCHDPRGRAPSPKAGIRLAMRREPSSLTPPPDGANPFSFPLLVQPVLDRNCVACHAKNRPKAPDLARGDFEKHRHKFYASYDSLRPYAFFYEPAAFTQPSTLPGQFGARAAKLHALLTQGHHGVSLSREDMARLTLWLDCNSDFFGAYHDITAQACGEVIQPSLQ
jgi:hypothetical protein